MIKYENMSEDQKISLEFAIKVWGSVISLLLSVIIYLYISDGIRQREVNEQTTQFMAKQAITNNVIFDLITDYHPDAAEKMIKYINKNERLNMRPVK